MKPFLQQPHQWVPNQRHRMRRRAKRVRLVIHPSVIHELHREPLLPSQHVPFHRPVRERKPLLHPSSLRPAFRTAQTHNLERITHPYAAHARAHAHPVAHRVPGVRIHARPSEVKMLPRLQRHTRARVGAFTRPNLRARAVLNPSSAAIFMRQRCDICYNRTAAAAAAARVVVIRSPRELARVIKPTLLAVFDALARVRDRRSRQA
mmetsp:Transcript_5107/g.16888  ORF Transcript_5107/g.16888 Transcript_5107/m.16888 type:complete len:206 (+) Transcript_5107:2177-2794(+)